MWKQFFVAIFIFYSNSNSVSGKSDTNVQSNVMIPMPPNGYSTGYLTKCGTGIKKPAMIKQKQLKKLTISSLDDGGMFAKRKLYTYFQVKEIANDPYIDFKKKPTLIYCPGYLDMGINSHLGQSLGTYYKNKGYNVLLLDLSTFSIMEYPKAVRLRTPLSFHIAEMISNLTSIGLNPKNLTMLGLSLGGQTMSFIAKIYRKFTGLTIGKLTALDPAGPCYRNLGPEERLDKTDADYVEVINTNIDGFGFGAAVGHVNFYINGGEYQPLDLAFWLPCGIVCSHIKVVAYWAAALENPNGFVGIKCSSVQEARERDCHKNKPMVTNIMGLDTDRTKEGIFFVPTTNKYPYVLGKSGMKKENDFVDQQFTDVTKEDFMIF